MPILPTANTAVGLFYPFHSPIAAQFLRRWRGIYTDCNSAKYTRIVPPLAFSESTELHRVPQRIEFMIVRLVAKGDALTLKLL